MRSRFRGVTRPSCWLCLTAISTLAIAMACARPTKRPSPQQVREILAKGHPLSESSFYACLINGYEQGLPLKQIQDECETKLAMDDKKGFGPGGADIPPSLAQPNNWYDPTTVTGACNSGDPNLAKGPDGSGRIQWNYQDGRSVDWGEYTWGGKGECDSKGCYIGLTEDQSSALKTQNVRDANKAIDDYQEKRRQSEMDPDDAAKKKAADDAKKAAEKAAGKAQEDPNKAKPKQPEAPKSTVSTDDTKAAGKGGATPGKTETKADDTKAPGGKGGKGGGGGNVSSVGDASPCEEALQGAREVLGECMRTGWRSGPCKSLEAKVKGCLEPELIYVDPDSGYECGQKIDPELLKNAWVEKCRELKRPVPGGPDPCEPPKVDATGRFVAEGSPEWFCGNPLVLVDPDSPECLGTVTVQEFAPNLQKLLVWALNKLGGPIVVLPDRDPKPPPGPGPEPRPVPR